MIRSDVEIPSVRWVSLNFPTALTCKQKHTTCYKGEEICRKNLKSKKEN